MAINERQRAALRSVATNQPKYDERALQALSRNAPTADDILNNEDFMSELNSEVDKTYHGGKLGMKEPEVADEIEEEWEMPANDLDADLAKIEAQLAVEQAQRAAEAAQAEEEAEAEEEVAPQSREEAIREQILELLGSSKGAPSTKQIAALKAKYGENGVNVLALGEGDVYIFTYLRRGQWKKIQEVVAKAAQTEAFASQAEDLVKEKVIQNCVLWPRGVGSIEFQYNSRAGVMDTLYEVVMLHSYFLNTQQAMSLTIAL